MLGTPDTVLTRSFPEFLYHFIFVTYFETGSHASQSGLEFWLAEDSPELLVLLPLLLKLRVTDTITRLVVIQCLEHRALNFSRN